MELNIGNAIFRLGTYSYSLCPLSPTCGDNGDDCCTDGCYSVHGNCFGDKCNSVHGICVGEGCNTVHDKCFGNNCTTVHHACYGKYCKSRNDVCYGDFCEGRHACYGKKCTARQGDCYGIGCTSGYWDKSHEKFQLSKEIIQCCPDCFEQAGKMIKQL